MSLPTLDGVEAGEELTQLLAIERDLADDLTAAERTELTEAIADARARYKADVLACIREQRRLRTSE